MVGVKRLCKKATKIALGVVVGVGIIGFVKGLFVGYLICEPIPKPIFVSISIGIS